MNIEQANGIDLRVILKTLGFAPAQQRGHDLMFFSPFRKEKTPSLHVDTSINVWYDFGEGKGGDVINFVCRYLESHKEDHTIVDSLRWLKNMQPAALLETLSKEEAVHYGSTLELCKTSSLQNTTLIDYLYARGIPLAYAKKYLKEIHVRNGKSGKVFYAVGLPNENGGYELRNKFFKGCIAPKAISFIRGKKSLPESVHVFEGFMDYLSALASQKTSRFEGDVIILNSTALLLQSFPYIKDYSYKTLFTWLDNDATGKKATMAFNKFVADEENLVHKPMNAIYRGHKDVNEWHMRKLKLKLPKN